MSSAEPSIAPATTEDVFELARLRWELYVEHDGPSDELFDAYRDRFVGFAIHALGSERWHAWVARVGDRPVGAMWLQTVPRVPIPGRRAGPIGYLTNVYVAPEHRNAGLGAKMLDQVSAWCREHGCSLVVTWPTERSRPFYRRGGFDRLDEPLVLDLGADPPL
jgi:GNAT superfamily N-acetyltransferase